MALTQDRALSEKLVPHGPEFGHPVAEGFRVYRGSLVAVCADGTIVPAGATNTPSAPVAIVGLARQFKDNSAAGSMLNGDMVGSHPIWVKKGCYALPFDTAPTWANLNQTVYAVDDETVSLNQSAPPPKAASASTGDNETASTPSVPAASRLPVGTLVGFEPDGTPFVLIS
ncbi:MULTISPECIES: hypothetical protein [unclassified Saccharibacter]|uniref:hypothetical protein n=1 Tax=unclassified Saccharibacter TaxID=2648722 RepID=UPI00132A37E7|nr:MULTISPECIES: hypothetical protein [unclassified Saccharibacter]MXV35834.1 hypothetical protein [Saccharibacter sp. EH611]MXV57955.1 hypothetical protein [Saccharibacter sp. EH70]MXV66350.1 hypothetical protein [Saccharibacter sp. EH60]